MPKGIVIIVLHNAMDRKSALGEAMSVEEKRKLKKDLKSLRMEDVSSFMEALPPDFLIVLRAEYEKELKLFLPCESSLYIS